ncbi:phosphatidylinositol transfer protein [Cyanidioschyzon merolae strain 10D]|uniref:Phosphatidylinositol transfer protein n=1 Tax=Cyanidioschyzon merolae (strain NIES-3377 / 10D) TaxID=280699 RepID=M1VB98_CYAM1|nr:phosphatidylinositol transfer protein [Cyanidioschyzon merolae strain 10D]BAM79542.1 phosphatidylinositol transfer protein [Cyanidioschyzon merolae strain 10D]|eukprot:XP_005535828.1 phosphatidylinositol transfer protein [Cyanidioschyzon merolae strain 10D]
MLIKEYRLLLPCSVDEYFRAQLYMVAKAAQQETGKRAGEGLVIEENRPYAADDPCNEYHMPPGQYTKKVFYLKSKVPAFVRFVMPESALTMVERSWNAYPHCLTVYSNEWLGDKFRLSVETVHAPDAGTQTNPLNLKDDELRKRQVDFIDISCAVPRMEPNEDPTSWQSRRTGRGPLVPGRWYYESQPVMCAYKLCKLEFRKWGLQTMVEEWGHKYGLKYTFIRYHRKLVCWMDEWIDMTIEDIRRMEDETAAVTRYKYEYSLKHGGTHDGIESDWEGDTTAVDDTTSQERPVAASNSAALPASSAAVGADAYPDTHLKSKWTPHHEEAVAEASAEAVHSDGEVRASAPAREADHDFSA